MINPLEQIKERMDAFHAEPDNSGFYFDQIKNFVTSKLDIDLSHYRSNFLHRRLYLRLQKLGISTYRAYLNYIDSNPEELLDFKQDFTIHVTTFFRDIDPFRYIEKTLFPQIVKLKRNCVDKTIRILSAPCSTGEEPYSMAIITHHLKKKKYYSNPIKIFACDIDDNVIKKAQTGIYDSNQLKNISYLSIKRNFYKFGENQYKIKPEIQSFVQFFTHNLLKPINLYDFDIVLCRNFLIYISKEMQKKVMENLIPSMADNCYLILGKTEGFPLLNTNLFKTENVKEHIYQLIR